MFDSGFLEMLVIGVVALLVVGPERLPGLARKAGHLIGKARAFVNTTKADIEKELEAEEMKSMLSRQEQEISELRDMMQDATQTIHKEVEALDENLAEKTNMNLGDSDDETALLTDTDNVKKDG
jgi:sec-independent protein translocase protein TatB